MVAEKDIQFLKSFITKREAIDLAIRYGGLGSSLKEQGFWDASTNTPTLADGIGTVGYFWVVSEAGSVDFGDGLKTFSIGDWVYYSSEATYEKFETGVSYVPEDAANKATDFSTVNDTLYPSVEAVKEQLDLKLDLAGGTVDELVVGDPGLEASGINIGGATYESTFKVSDIDGTNFAQTILHRHSTTLEPLIVGARANSDTSAHADVVAGQNVFTVFGAGYAGSNYKLFASMSMGVDSSGTISNTSAPGKVTFSVTPDGSVTPAAYLTVTNDKKATFAGNVKANALNSEVNTETLAAGKSILATDNQIQELDPDGADRIITMYASPNVGDTFGFYNSGGAGFNLVINDNGGTEIVKGSPGLMTVICYLASGWVVC